MKKLYQCEICGYISEDEENVKKCENCGVPIPLANEGDIIYFSDCEETPILYDLYDDKFFSIAFVGNDFYSLKTKAYNLARFEFNTLKKYKVEEISVIGHDISYKLSMIEGESHQIVIYNKCGTYYYPIIKGNNLMKKNIEKYNT